VEYCSSVPIQYNILTDPPSLCVEYCSSVPIQYNIAQDVMR